MTTGDHNNGQGRDRTGAGRYTRTVQDSLRAARAVELRAQGYSYTQIAKELGYTNKGSAWRVVHVAVAEAVSDSVKQLVAVEASRLDQLAAAAEEVLEREHHAHSNGRLVLDADGQPLVDDGPKLAAIRELRNIGESYRRLLGLDQPAKVSVDGGVRYEVVGINPEDLT